MNDTSNQLACLGEVCFLSGRLTASISAQFIFICSDPIFLYGPHVQKNDNKIA